MILSCNFFETVNDF